MSESPLATAYRAAVAQHGFTVARTDDAVYTVGLSAQQRPEVHLTFGPAGVAGDVQTATEVLRRIARAVLDDDAAKLFDALDELQDLAADPPTWLNLAAMDDPAPAVPVAATVYGAAVRAQTVQRTTACGAAA